MPNEPQLRTADLGDEVALARLCASVQAIHWRERPDFFKEIDLAGLERWFRGVLAERSATVWICHVGDEAAGYVLVRKERRPENVFHHHRHWHEVDQISVEPRFQRRGIAEALLRRVAESAAAEGVDEVELNTWYFNEDAQTAFAKLGFSVKNVRFSRKAQPAKP
jgi:ribosomal protein S18 acetylase RimI-like enzyme